MDPSFTYAHTLCGHEYANNEDLDKAVQAFRHSLLHDDRHYNAWYARRAERATERASEQAPALSFWLFLGDPCLGPRKGPL